MSKKISRKDLIEKRKQWQAERELDQDLRRDINHIEYEREFQERLLQGKNRYVLAIINMVFTFLMLFIFFFILQRAFPVLYVVNPAINILIIGLSLVSGLSKRPVVGEYIFRSFMIIRGGL